MPTANSPLVESVRNVVERTVGACQSDIFLATQSEYNESLARRPDPPDCDFGLASSRPEAIRNGRVEFGYFLRQSEMACQPDGVIDRLRSRGLPIY